MRYSRIGAAGAALAAIVLVVVGCSMFSSSTPTGTFKAFYEATKKKDPAAIKKTLSKGSIEMMEKMAKDQGKSLDDVLKEDKVSDDKNPDKLPEMRNEKITGDTATLEIKPNSKDDEWDTLPFTKEDGVWKIAFDKFIDDLKTKLKDKTGAP